MNPWDTLSDAFDTYKQAHEINPYAADNILIAWPALLEGIHQVQPSGEGLCAFDFGCGAGSFAGELSRRGYKVEAADTSAKMIALAKQHLGKTIRFHLGGADIAPALSSAPFALVTSIMALQFIDPLDATLDALGRATATGGLFGFAVFNPDYIAANTGSGCLFETGHRTGITMVTDGMRIPVYPRSADAYDALLKTRGYRRLWIRRPRFTRAFLMRYPQSTNTRFSEYLVMLYQKQPT